MTASFHFRHKIFGCAASMLLVLMLCEGAARLVPRGSRWLHPYYVEMSKGFSDLDELIRDQNTHVAPKYYDEFLYAAAPVSLTHINFTDYYSARRTPDSVPLSQAKHIVWTFGGSTMENTETTDELTIANTLARVFNHEIGPAHVKNFGTGGFFSSYQLIKFQRLLREVREAELPTMAIFYDGYNDAQNGFQYGPGRIQVDLSRKFQALVEKRNHVTATYAISSLLSGYSAFWDRTAARLVNYLLFPFPEPQPDAANVDKAVRVYTSNARIILAICNVFGIRCILVLQPLLMTKEPLTELEQKVLMELEAHPRFSAEGTRFVREFYNKARSEMAGNDRFIDASRILNGRIVPDFYDFGHTSVQTSPIIGRKIAQMVLARLETKEARKNLRSERITQGLHFAKRESNKVAP